MIVGPPKFAPEIDNVITLYDTRSADRRSTRAGCSEPASRPTPTTSTRSSSVAAGRVAAATSSAPTRGRTRSTTTDTARRSSTAAPIPGRRRRTMPLLNSGDPDADAVRCDAAWEATDKFVQDWAGAPAAAGALVACGLDRAALDSCVGAAFFPGIEAGGITAQPIVDPTKFVGRGPVPPQPRCARARRARRVHGGAVAGRLLGLRTQLVAGPAPERRLSSGRRSAPGLGPGRRAASRRWSPSGTPWVSSCARATSSSRSIAATRRSSPCSRRTSTSRTCRRARWAPRERRPSPSSSRSASPASGRSRCEVQPGDGSRILRLISSTRAR